jgi:DNA helicase HerA-like ATPase
MRLVNSDRSRHKLVLFDEAHFLLDSASGRRLADRLNRMGRSMNATLLLASQRLSDSGDLEALIGTRMIFGQETESEARRALELLGLDPDDRALIAKVRGYRKGRCLIRDIHDRVAETQIDLVNPDWLRILDTTPQAHEIAA